MADYLLTVGLEVHAELKTRTKMFCNSANDPDEKRPNVNICPICMGHPGTLPTINEQAVKSVLRVGLAVNGTLAGDFTEFDRKNYFYPDIPKGYQISQYEHPLVKGGELAGVKLTRIHLEEDTARSQHGDQGRSLVDFNRAGVPLMELVTEPVITTAVQAGNFARELQLLMRYLDVSEANMEKGEMRVEANISISPKTTFESSEKVVFGTKVEVKNLNSFRSVERAIEYEIKRQGELLDKGEKVAQETRGWDEVKETTFSQREKESSHDYRYFPEPDLPKLRLKDLPWFADLPNTIPELPWQKRERYQNLGLKSEDVEQYVSDFKLAAFIDAVIAELKESELIKVASNFIANDVAGKRKKEVDLPDGKAGGLPDVKVFIAVVRKYHNKELPSPQAKSSILNGVIAEVVSDDSLASMIEKIIADNPKAVAEYKSGKAESLQFLIGQGMKLSRGSANPQTLSELFKKML